MLSRTPSSAELKEMLRLAAPIVAVNVGLHLMGVVDTMMLGRVSATQLAAGALGNFYFHNTSLIGVGVLLVLDPVIAQARGARDEAGVARGVQRGVLLAVALTIVVAAMMWPSAWVVGLLRQPEEIQPLTAQYVRWCIPGLLPFFLMGVARQTLQAFRAVGPVIVAAGLGTVSNIFLNWVLIYGNLGFEPRGVVGAAQATSISRWLMLVVVLASSWRLLRPAVMEWHRESFASRPLGRMLWYGLPIGLQFLAEVGAFGLATLMAGWLGTTTLAGHEITLSLAALTFMVPLGVASAASVMVGHAVGAGDTSASRRDAVAALVLGVGFMACCGLVFAFFPDVLARAYTTDAAAAAVAISLLPIAAAFAVFDGTQVIASGILRGTADTHAAAIIHLVSFWAFGIPLAAWLAFGLGWGATGIWWGLTLGLVSAAVLQLRRARARLRGPVGRVRIDHGH